MEDINLAESSSIHGGHRERLREQYFRDGGLDGFSDVQVLEFLLFYTRKQVDTNEIAHRLLDAFGSLKGVFEARPEQLVKVQGMGKESAILISMMREMYKRYYQCLAMEKEKQKISNRSLAQDYCQALMAGQRTEQFRVICLDAQCKVIGNRKITEGSLSEVAAYPRIVVEAALNYNAHSVILTHNHPGGTPAPSPEDISSTLQLQKLLGGLGIIVLDHIIVANETTYSMIQHGDIDYKLKMKENGTEFEEATAKEAELIWPDEKAGKQY